jgi:hypothetical protein
LRDKRNKKAFTLWISEETHGEIKAFSKKTGLKIKDIVEKSINFGLPKLKEKYEAE